MRGKNMGTIQERGDLWNTEQLTEFPTQPNNSPPPLPPAIFCSLFISFPVEKRARKMTTNMLEITVASVIYHVNICRPGTAVYLDCCGEGGQFTIPMQEVSTM
jgi:hypothetical protein